MSLRDIVKTRVLEEIIGSLKDDSWKVMVVDNYCLTILSSICRISEITKQNITIIESLEKSRQPFPNLGAIYFLTPTEKSVELMIADFEKGKKYSCAYLYFTSRVPDKIMNMVIESKASKYVKSLVEANMEFIPIEPTGFSFNYQEDIESIYGSSESKSMSSDYLHMADKLLTVCATLNQAPYIRYSAKSQNCKAIAEQLHTLLEKFKKGTAKNKSIKLKSESVILIVDRSIDSLAPLLHEFTYSAMATDIFNIGPNNVYLHSFIDNSNKKQTREVKLDDFDPVWAKYRHMHMSMMLDLLKKESQDFIEQNRDVASIADRSSKKDTKEIAAVITKLPDYQEKIAKYGVHTNLARELMNKITVDLLNKVAIVEQNMAVGQDEKGKSLDSGKLFKELIELMDHKKISIENKARLVIIYYISQRPEFNKVTELSKRAGLPEKYVKAMKHLSCLGVKPLESAMMGSITKFLSKLLKANNDNDYLLLSRYKAKIKEVAEDVIKGTAKEPAFPFVKAPDSSFKLSDLSSSSSEKKSNKNNKKDDEELLEEKKESLRSRKKGDGPAWKKEKESPTTPLGASGADKFNGKKLIVFVLGGITHSELRMATELREEFKMEVYCGSTSVLNPSIYIEKLASIVPGLE